MRKTWFAPYLLLFYALFSHEAFADFSITSASLNGGVAISVAPAATITLAITLNYSGNVNGANGQWGSTQWTVNGVSTCNNHANQSSPGPDSTSFSITAPNSTGIYDLTIKPYSNDSCGGQPGPDYIIASAISTQFLCVAPTGAPAGLTCYCDDFNRATLNPSPIFNANWLVTTSDITGILPRIATPGRLQLTANTGNNAKAATVPGLFPGASNYLSVEFLHYAYPSSGGADGMVVTLSDASVPPVPGGFGGSLGYAQRSPNINGFAGGWIGLGIDEFGNYSNPTEGRIGGPGQRVDSVAIRGSGTLTSGYPYLGGTVANLSPGIDTTINPGPGYWYQIIVDARTATKAVQVNRNTGSGYTSLISLPNIAATATSLGYTQAAVPDNWLVSFTGSTGGSMNFHEIGQLRICAASFMPPSGSAASGFNAVDEAYGIVTTSPGRLAYLTGHIYTKLVGSAFKLNVAAIASSDLMTTYVASGSKIVTVKLVDNDDDACQINSNLSNYCSATCKAKAAVTGGSQTLTFVAADKGVKQSASFTLGSVYKKLVAIISDGTTSACATDAFSVRPHAFLVSKTVTALNAGAPFTLQATAVKSDLTTATTNYTGTPTLSIGALTGTPAFTAAALLGALPAATAGVSSGTFTYDDVGSFTLPATSPDTYGISDSTYAVVDGTSDCVAGSASNTVNGSGKYGCLIGQSAALTVGTFIPDHFEVSAPTFTPGCGSFTYMLQPFQLGYTVTAKSQARAAPTANPPGNTALKLYAGGKLNIAAINGSTELTTRLSSVVANPLTPTWTNGSYTQPPTAYTFSRPGTTTADATWGAFESLDIGLGIDDPAGVAYPTGVVTFAATTPATCLSGSECKKYTSLTGGAMAKMRFGRLKLSNAFGSDNSNLNIPVQAHYWSGQSWVPNNADSCTSLPATAFFLVGAMPGNAVQSGFTLAGGVGTLTLTKPSPTATGSIDVAVNLGATGSDQSCLLTHGGTAANLPWLRSQNGNCAATYDRDPSARATFGIYAPETRKTVHVRESY